ncbi:S24 family peptidase [Chryseobacterium sp. G0240]|uniref:S24 family peptidase n=1 Tax=Chryseobacterium sp. G0240 TaxID=2487066 RepID=UPI000F456853|nr:S24 family peptidase [Chryseobacterium sp. G0240]ROI03697.1 S24 family peptidase [Chryseobacterium sp. G0240]
MMDNEKLQKKIRGFYNYIRERSLRNKDIIETTKFGKGNISNYMNGKVNPSENFLITFEKCYNVNLEDYENETPIYNEVKPKTYSTHLEVRVVTNKARAGYTDSYYADEYLKDLPVVLIDADKEYKGKYLAFEVDGDSMEPEYHAGDIVICREVKRDLWQYKLHYKDYDFVIAHGTKGIMLKEITDHNIETGEIVCHSLNNGNGQHEDFVLNLKEVSFLYNVVEHRRSGKNKRRFR